MDNGFTRASSERRPPALRTGRLTASKVCRSSSEAAEARNELERSDNVHGVSQPSSSLSPLLTLSHPRYGLPDALVKNFASMGIQSIYPWQSSCLLGRGLLTGEKNLVYTAPTGGGKSLVADILMLKRVLGSSHAKAILVLPYVALVQEKVNWLRKAIEGVEKEVHLPSQLPDLKRPHSSRTANMLVNTAIEQHTIDDLGIVVLDELHMIDDDHRGYLMELLTTKILSLEQKVQIVGMSATLPNTQLLAKWLDAKFYISKYKPVPIREYLVLGNSVHSITTSSAFFRAASQTSGLTPSQPTAPSMTIQPSTHNELRNPTTNAVVALAVETASQGHGALVFCGGRQACQTTALLVSQAMSDCNHGILENRQDVIDNLRSLPVGLDELLEKTIPRGVAFHRLTSEEREILASAYDERVISVIVATCSLAAGINLPARRVILHGVRMGREPIGPAMLCAVERAAEAKIRALLEIITIRLAVHINAVKEYMQRTLLYHTMDTARLTEWVEATIDELRACGQVSVNSTGFYEATPVSRATVGACMTPEDGVFIYDELQRASKAFVMDGEMHVFYMFTPVNISSIGDINWRIYRNEIERLDESGMRALEANSGKQFTEDDGEQIRLARIYRRFYAAFQLRDLCNEVPVHRIAKKFEIQRGFVQTLAQTCEGFAAGMIQFCDTLRWGMMKSVLEHMADRLQAGARADLLDLARIPFVKGRTARVFWENGVRSLRAVAEAEAKELLPLLLLHGSNNLKSKRICEAKGSKLNGSTSEISWEAILRNMFRVEYSMYGHIKKMADAELEGIKSAGGTADLYQVAETLPEEVLAMLHAPPKDTSIPNITPEKLQEYDGVLFGIPTRYGNFPAQWKAFFDSTGGQWMQGSFWGKYAGLFVSTAGLGGGQESTCIAAMSTLAHHGMIYVPLGYKTTFGQLTNLEEVHGGSPWGAGTFAGSDGARQPTPLEIEVATAQGKAFYEAVAKAH
ncbi:MAG: hypothetical protein Q9173_001192, partial [Seirophora scorigena]